MMRHALTRWLGALLLALHCDLSLAGDWNEQLLLTEVRQQARPVVRFTEVQQLSYLEVPLRSQGLLEFRAPDYLRRSLSTGGSFEILAERLVMTEAKGGRREFALDALPGLRVFAESLRATLSGDVAQLQRHFYTELHGQRAQWELRLLPRDATLAAVVEHISLFGRAGIIERIESHERSGDSTITRLEPVRD